MSSVRTIARQAGVSITTVSRALNNDPAVSAETRHRVLAIANRFGYAAKMGRRNTAIIGFAHTGEQTLADAFDSAVLGGVVRGVNECRFDVMILNMQRDKRRNETFTQFFMRKGVRGVILRTTTASRESCEAIADEGFPHVVISERFDAGSVSYIDCDSKADSVRAVDYLIALGHRRIAFAMHSIPDRDHLDRYEGYKEALAAHKLPCEDRLLFRQKFTLAGGATVMKMVLSMADRPTAIFFADPLLAVGAIKKANELGVSIPTDISVVGFDDTDVRFSVHPTMTAVCQDASVLGYEAALYLTRALASTANGTLQKTLPTFFEINQSTGSPPPAFLRPAVGDTRAGRTVASEDDADGAAAPLMGHTLPRRLEQP